MLDEKLDMDTLKYRDVKNYFEKACQRMTNTDNLKYRNEHKYFLSILTDGKYDKMKYQMLRKT